MPGEEAVARRSLNAHQSFWVRQLDIHVGNPRARVAEPPGTTGGAGDPASVRAGSLVDGEFGGWVSFETLVGDGCTAQRRAPVGADSQALLGALDCL